MVDDSTKGIDPGVHRVLADASRVAVLETLRRADRPLAIPELAAAVGLHANTVRAHLALLTEHGYVTGGREDRSRPGRPRLLYTAVTRHADDGGRGGYRLLAEALMSYLGDGREQRAGAAVAAGRAFGGRAVRSDTEDDAPGGAPSGDSAGDGDGDDGAGDVAIGVIVDLLARTGFEPRQVAGGSLIELHRCPFRELAVEDPDVVCGVHLGIMQGALAELGTPVAATRLLPFVRPGVCVAALEPPGTAGERGTADGGRTG